MSWPRSCTHPVQREKKGSFALDDEQADISQSPIQGCNVTYRPDLVGAFASQDLRTEEKENVGHDVNDKGEVLLSER